MIKKSNYREYKSIRNYAKYRCHSVSTDLIESYWVEDDCPSEFFEENVAEDIESWSTGIWTWGMKTMYFENSEDALVFKLKYSVGSYI